MAQDEPQDSAGPSSPPPPLPEGWLAQWEGVSRKWYFVQRATGKSQWEIPTDPVVLTPSTTPGSIGSGPTQAPESGMRPLNPQAVATDSPDIDGTKGFFSNSATRPSLSGILGSHGTSGITQIADRVLNRISKDFLSNKPTNNATNQASPANTNNTSTHASYGSGPNSLQSQAGHNPYGYASTNQAGNYTGSAPQYYPQGQGPMQQGQSPQQPDFSHGQFGFANSSAYPQYQTANQPPHSHMSAASQPWQSQNSFVHNNPPTYQPLGAHGNNGPPMPVPTQPEWQTGAHPPIPHSTKPNSNNLLAMSNQTQPHNNYQPSYHHQMPQQHQGQPIQNTHAHSQMIPENPQHQQNLYGPPGTAGPIHQNPPQSTNNFEQNMQHVSQQGGQNPSPYNPNGGMIPGPPTVTSTLQNNIPTTPSSMALSAAGSHLGGLSQHSNPVTPSSHYPVNSMPNNLPVHNATFAVELPDNQINATRPTTNMQNYPPAAAQNHGQPFPQAGVTQQPPPPFSNPMGAEFPGAEPIRHTPTDPQFVSGPWTSPPSTSNNHYPPSRYNNTGGF